MLFWLLVLGLIIYLLARGGSKSPVDSVETRLAERNREWVSFIAGYRKVVKSKSDKALLDRMLADIQAQGLAASGDIIEPTKIEEPQPVAYSQSQAAGTAETISIPAIVPKPAEPKVELDNVSLLLYFGAFLFVASVGLFIVFGGANGAIRTIAVLLVMAVLYGSGIWLFRSKPKLIQAGVAFSGIGMTIAPLAGVAAYYYLVEQTHGSAVWFITSAMCLIMYVHAMWVFRRPLVSYILIFTFLSLFESGISIISAPIYYFGWAMALISIILSVASRLKGFWPEMQESSRLSAQVILPLSVLTSVVLVPTHGAGQLGISLLFAAAFYALEAMVSKGADQETNAVTTHVTALAGLLCLSYSFGNSWKVVATTLLVVNVLQMLAILFMPQKGGLWRNFASVLMGAGLTGIMIGWVSPGILLASLAAIVPICLIIWRRQHRTEAYVFSVLAWTAVPIVFGQIFLAVTLDSTSQATLLLSALLVQLGVYLWYKPKNRETTSWLVSAQQVYVIAAAATVVAALFASAWACFALSLGVTATLILLAEYEKDGDWAIIAGLTSAAPIIRSVDTSGVLVASTLTALLLNIGLALRYRKELNRWFSAVLWLILPLSLGSGIVGGRWSAAAYGWGYLAVTLALVLSRAIARGNLLVSAKVPLASYAKTASNSYVVGYWLAAILAISLSLAATNARLHATAILGAVAVIVYALGRYIEERADLLAMLPLFAQAILWSALRPIAHDGSMTAYLLMSTILAAGSYCVGLGQTSSSAATNDYIVKIQEGALAAVFVTPAAAFVISELSWTMPFGLLVAGLLVYYHVRHTSQSNRELAGAISVAAVMWFMWYGGVRELQAYTHVVVALLAFYAYWRAIRKETAQSDQYLLYMLGVATVPLSFQALGGQAGGLYGWWLLLEQIAFMLIGMAIKKRVVTLWGLYVAVGAVLYQLRDLGWAALTVLAMFLIGIAVYKLQGHSDKN